VLKFPGSRTIWLKKKKNQRKTLCCLCNSLASKTIPVEAEPKCQAPAIQNISAPFPRPLPYTHCAPRRAIRTNGSGATLVFVSAKSFYQTRYDARLCWLPPTAWRPKYPPHALFLLLQFLPFPLTLPQRRPEAAWWCGGALLRRPAALWRHTASSAGVREETLSGWWRRRGGRRVRKGGEWGVSGCDNMRLCCWNCVFEIIGMTTRSSHCIRGKLEILAVSRHGQ